MIVLLNGGYKDMLASLRDANRSKKERNRAKSREMDVYAYQHDEKQKVTKRRQKNYEMQ